MLWNLAVYQTKRDRRQARRPKTSVWKLPVKCTADRRVLAARYAAHMAHIGSEPHFADPRSVTRQTNGQVARGRLKVSMAPRRRDRRGRSRGGWRSTYTFTRAGKRHIFRLRTAATWEATL